MKKLVAVLLCAFAMNAHAIPSVSNIKMFKARMNLYISMKQTPQQIVASLNAYYGKDYFMLRSNGWAQTYDIIILQGSNTEVTYFETLGTVPAE